MSGTSLDGVDAALVDFLHAPGRLCATAFAGFPDALRVEALALNSPGGTDELARAARLGIGLAECYAAAVEAVLRAAPVSRDAVRAIGCHGQTVRHQPQAGYSLQLGNPALLAERTGLTVVSDFRNRDIAAGGQGAPLVPAFHAAFFGHGQGSRRVHRVILNLGGIANITDLPPQGPVGGFDTGPGNVLLDLWATTALGSRCDAGGRLAASGTVREELLARLLEDPYFALPPPKSTGRDRFNPAWLAQFGLDRYPPADVQASLAALTARTVAQAVDAHCPGAAEVSVCGGGVHNPDLMDRLAAAMPGRRICSTAEAGLDPDYVEAFAFAWLAHATLAGRPGNLPAVTGAAGPRILGAIYPA